MNIIKLKAKPVILMPGDTVSGIIKKINLFKTQQEDMVLLLKQFSEINAPGVLKPGMKVLIPVLDRLHDEVFNH